MWPGEGGERRRVFAVPQNESSWGDNGPEWRSGAGTIGPLSLAGGGDDEALEGNAVAALLGEWAASRPGVGRGTNAHSLLKWRNPFPRYPPVAVEIRTRCSPPTIV